MITTRRYKVITEDNGVRVTYEYIDTYFLGIRCKRDITEVSRRGTHISAELRDTIKKLDLDMCVYCGWYNDLAKTPKDQRVFTIDHIYPQVHGGESTIFNLVWACRKCNSTKSGRTPLEAGMTLEHGRFSEGAFLPMDRATFMAFADGDSWEAYVRDYPMYCVEFQDAFIACDGLIPFRPVSPTQRYAQRVSEFRVRDQEQAA